MLQSLCLSDDSCFHQSCIFPLEDDIFEVDKKDLVNLEVVGILLLEISPNSLNSTQQVRNSEAEL